MHVKNNHQVASAARHACVPIATTKEPLTTWCQLTARCKVMLLQCTKATCREVLSRHHPMCFAKGLLGSRLMGNGKIPLEDVWGGPACKGKVGCKEWVQSVVHPSAPRPSYMHDDTYMQLEDTCLGRQTSPGTIWSGQCYHALPTTNTPSPLFANNPLAPCLQVTQGRKHLLGRVQLLGVLLTVEVFGILGGTQD